MLKEQVPTKEMQAKIDELYRRYPNGLVANIQKGEVPKRIKELAKYLDQLFVFKLDTGQQEWLLQKKQKKF